MASSERTYSPGGSFLALAILICGIPVLRATNERNELTAAATSGPIRQLAASVNTKRLVNVLDDEFISFSANPQDIFDGQGNPISETSFLMAQSLGRTYLKVVADSSQLHLQTAAGRSLIGGPDDAGLVQIKASAWHAFYEWAHRAGLVPVFVLDYPTGDGRSSWDAKRALQVLTAASGLGIEECRWQLGNGNITDITKYGEDLKTFRTMLKAFPKHQQHWRVVACELAPSEAVPLEDVQYFNANFDTPVAAFTISKPLYGDTPWNYRALQREVHLRGLSKRQSLWLDLKDERAGNKPDERGEQIESRRNCDSVCLRQGLEYARTLGEAARSGVSVVFKPVHRAAIQEYTLNYLTALLYKRTVGSKVFSVQRNERTMATSEWPHETSVYAYCTRNVTGSVTLVLVNEDEAEATNATVKLMSRALSSPVELFLVSVQNGQPMVNNRAVMEGTAVPQLVPVTAITTLTAGVSFYVPPQTILFAIVPGVQVRECRTSPSEPRAASAPEELVSERSSTDVLLQELIGELLEKVPQEPLQRKRRAVLADPETQSPRLMALGGAAEKRKQKRFHARFAGSPQDGKLAASLAQALEIAQPEATAVKEERSARGPRQTQAYKRQQRRVRQKEKRSEKRQLRKLKHPLLESQRERSKRAGRVGGWARSEASRLQHPNHRQHERLLKRMSAKLASRKTKRSSLAEAVNEPPRFLGSDEEEEEEGQQSRSDYPVGDVHLVISKTPEDGTDYVAEEEEEEEKEDREKFSSKPMDYRSSVRRTSRQRPSVRQRRITVSQRDFLRRGWDSEEERRECSHRCALRRRADQEPEVRDTRRIDRYMTIRKETAPEASEEESSDPELDRDGQQQGSRNAFSIAKPPTSSSSNSRKEEPVAEEMKQKEEEEEVEEEVEGSSPHDPAELQQLSGKERTQNAVTEQPGPQPASEEEVHLYTPAPRTSEELQEIAALLDPPQWSLESTSAEVAEVLHRRYKRSDPADSVESHEVARLENFFRTNAKLQQKFAEMFDLLLEAIEELESDEVNDAREEQEEEEEEEKKQVLRAVGEVSANDAAAAQMNNKRTKRNALLHPQSWESRERSNIIHRIQGSEEEGFVHSQPASTSTSAAQMPEPEPQEHGGDEQDPGPLGSDEGKPGAFVLRSVVNFMRRATSEFHQLFSGWFSKTS